jgi:bifunctional DNase/RNase
MVRWLGVAAIVGAACSNGVAPVATAPAAKVTAPALPSEPTGLPAGYVTVSAATVVPTGTGAAVLLLDEESDRVLPIFIGGTEATSIDLRLKGEAPIRPLTHDLFDASLARLGASLVKVHVDSLRDGIFIGSVFVREAGGRVIRIDARPSDAIALAIGNKVPIYVAREVLDEAGITRDELENRGGTPPPTPFKEDGAT